jgi:hypothetical protein
MTPTTRSNNRLSVAGVLTMARLALGLLHLLLPGALARPLLGRDLSTGERRTVRLLGIRQIGQATVTGISPSAARIALGLEIDAAHATSLIGVALLDRNRRRIALVGASMAGAFVFTDWVAIRIGGGSPT